MIPKPTPHTATRNTRSQSPPRRVQRTPVSQMQAAMPRSSIRPYIRIASGPTWTTPESGEGMLRSSTRQILPAATGRRAVERARAGSGAPARASSRDAGDRPRDGGRRPASSREPSRRGARSLRARAPRSATARPASVRSREGFQPQSRLAPPFPRRRNYKDYGISEVLDLPSSGDFTVPSVRRGTWFGGCSEPQLLQNTNVFLRNSGGAEQRLDLGEEVGRRLDAVVGAEREHARAL